MLTPLDAMERLVARLRPVDAERVALHAAAGRVLAEAVLADRDSPAHDVSAMDGYAVRLGDLSNETLAVAGEVATGHEPPEMPSGKALRIFTGGCVPSGAEAVIRREDVEEAPAQIRLTVPAETIRAGQNIRRRGENLAAGAVVVEAGEVVGPSVMSAMASFGCVEPTVYRRVRVGVVVTGDELLDVAARPEPWQLRDSNGPVVEAMFGALPWVDWQGVVRVHDSMEALTEALSEQLAGCDAVLLTGGVSMGDYDHVPAAVREVGGEVLFHKLAIRPGKPMLAAVGPSGQAILGLPGNPVSVMVTARLFGATALRRRAGFSRADAPTAMVRLVNADEKSLRLWWHRPVRLVGPGEAELVAGMGSGDVASAARSDGFVRLPAEAAGEGPWAYWPWSV
ncbi:molybdopterin molybdotransferase MoeA [Phycisphaerales bacterium AB-hyl4]|uniref:Molybdopterin molybdenumtransferase n=1 Tax=Natronomicrosphaera hydrolytica TaxID=3242702 RepID=A0ABV4U3Y0_9BACT